MPVLLAANRATKVILQDPSNFCTDQIVKLNEDVISIASLQSLQSSITVQIFAILFNTTNFTLRLTRLNIVLLILFLEFAYCI